MSTTFTLISHSLCPYVQRVAIVLAEKSLDFARLDIDLANKPEWFLHLSPLGKTPVLLVDGRAIFESAVICEYLDETVLPQLHPIDPWQRAQQRGWMEFASGLLGNIAGLYRAQDEATLAAKVSAISYQFALLETQLGAGPYFEGARFSLVDAAFGPVFRYFALLDGVAGADYFSATPQVRAWRQALADRASIKDAVSADYPQLLRAFVLACNGALAKQLV